MTLLARAPTAVPCSYTATRPGYMLEVNRRVDSSVYVLWSRRTNRVLLTVILYDDCWYTGAQPRRSSTLKASA